MSAQTRTVRGGCHCGIVRFELDSRLDEIVVCNCSMCAKKGFLHLIEPLTMFRILQGESDLTTYQFGTKTARHTFCRHCGITAFYYPRSHPDGVSVNARCIDETDLDLDLVPRRAFDGQNWEQNIEGLRSGD